MPTLLQQLDEHYPGWRKAHDTAIEAGIEIGLLDDDDIAPDYSPLDFHEYQDPRS